MKTYVRKSNYDGNVVLWVPLGEGRWLTVKDNGNWQLSGPPEYTSGWKPCQTVFDVYETEC